MPKPSAQAKITDVQFSASVAEANSYAQVCRLIGVRPGGTNQAAVKRRIAKLKLDISHFTPTKVPRQPLQPFDPKRNSGRWVSDLTDAEFIELAKHAQSFAQFTRMLKGRAAHAASYVTAIRSRAERLNVDISHFVYQSDKDAEAGRPRRRLTSLLDSRSGGVRYSKAVLKRRMLEEGLLENKCAGCGTGPEWQGQPMELALHCKNLDFRDQRLENLEILCWNCRFIRVYDRYSDLGRKASKVRKQNRDRQAYEAILQEGKKR
jgi:hypothetical protein